MFWILVMTVAIGVSTILQGGLNRQMMNRWDLGLIVLFNGLVYAVISLLCMVLARISPSLLPDIFHPREGIASCSWWYWIPAACGFLIVAGMPVVIVKLGAFRMIVIVVAVQLVASLIWDMVVEKTPMTFLRVAGAVLAFGGVILANLKTS
ncbi:MAG: DMT family transporter [Deltaproteobacteria bacterium]|nr:DMT family transporter [Deltaproteobacteria bacterium]